MITITEIRRAGQWRDQEARDRLVLGYDDRHRRRRRYKTEQGQDILLDLAETTVLRGGDALALPGGGVVVVAAADEALIEITAHSPAELARLAWHLGNRHLPAAIEGSRILIRDDHVIVAMLKGLGAHVREVQAPFDPEGGAYGEHNREGLHAQVQHAHDHGHSHDHDHPHDHDHSH